MAAPGGVPLLGIRPAQSAQLSKLTNPVYQEVILGEIQEAADTAFDDFVQDATRRILEPPWLLIIRGLPPSQSTAVLVTTDAMLGLSTSWAAAFIGGPPSIRQRLTFDGCGTP
jgi:hypothetical protein